MTEEAEREFEKWIYFRSLSDVQAEIKCEIDPKVEKVGKR